MLINSNGPRMAHPRHLTEPYRCSTATAPQAPAYMLLSTQAIRLLLFSVEQSKAAYRAEGVLFAVVVLTAIVTFMFQPNNLLWSGARHGANAGHQHDYQ